MVRKVKQGNFVIPAGMAGMKGLVPLMRMAMIEGLRHSQNTIFQKSSEMIITKAKLSVTFVIDLNP